MYCSMKQRIIHLPPNCTPYTHLSCPGARLPSLISSSRCRCSLLCCSTCILLHRKSPATRCSTRWCLLLRRATPALWRRSNFRSYISSSGWIRVSWAWWWHMVAVHGLRYTWNSQHYNHSTQSKSNTVIPWKTLNSKILGHLCWKKWALFVVWKIKIIRKSGKIWSQKCRSLRKWTLLHGSQCPATIQINPKKFRVSVSPPCRLFLEPKKKKAFSRSRSCRPSPCPLSAGLLVRVIDCKNIIYVDDCFMCNKSPSKSIVWCSPTRDAGLWPLKRDCDCGPLSVTATTLSDALTVITIYITCTSTARGSVRLHTRTVMYFMHLILSVVSQHYQIGMRSS